MKDKPLMLCAWIPVAQELPKFTRRDDAPIAGRPNAAATLMSDEVLVLEWGDCHRITHLVGGEGSDQPPQWYSASGVTHWMPLPDPPTDTVNLRAVDAARMGNEAIANASGSITDTERLAFLHTPNEDAEGYEFGIARVKYGAFGSIESCLWTAGDHSDIDAIIRRQRECKHQFGIFNGNPNSRCALCGVFESAHVSAAALLPQRGER